VSTEPGSGRRYRIGSRTKAAGTPRGVGRPPFFAKIGEFAGVRSASTILAVASCHENAYDRGYNSGQKGGQRVSFSRKRQNLRPAWRPDVRTVRGRRPGMDAEAGAPARRQVDEAGVFEVFGGDPPAASAPAVKPGRKTTGRPVRQGPGGAEFADGGPDTGHRLTAIRKQAFMPIIPECPVAGSTWGMGITIAYRRSTHMHMRSGLSAGVRGNRLGGGTNECAEL